MLSLGIATTFGVPRTVHVGTHIIHSPPRSRVHSRLTNGSSIPAGGAVWPTAIYWSTVSIGTPGVNFPVAIDSGSGDLDVAGKGCSGCVTKPPNNAYDPDASSTSSPAFPYRFSNTCETSRVRTPRALERDARGLTSVRIPLPDQTCDLKDPTAPCTISGSLHTDRVSLAGFGPVDVKFGAILSQTSNFDQFKEIDGVMGFTGGRSEDVFASLVAAGLCENVWAMCMRAGSKSNGTLTIGGVDPRLSDGEVHYVPDAGRGFHSVSVSSVMLGDLRIPVGEAAILDTGTNVLLVPPSLYHQLQTQMCANPALTSCAALWANDCVSLSDTQVDAYPPLALNLDGLALNMSSRDYLLLGSPLATSAGQYCLGIRNGGSAGGSGFIIGDTTMRHYYLVFDLERKRIGWGNVNEAGCGSVDEGQVAVVRGAKVGLVERGGVP